MKDTPRAPVAAFFRVVFGTLFLGSALAILGWWMTDTNVVPAGMIAAMLAFGGVVCLAGVPRSLRPANLSSGAGGRIVFKSPPPQRVGRRLEGSILLLDEAEPGKIYEVHLECTRQTSDGESEAFSRAGEVAVTMGADGLQLPFSFQVPIEAPPTFGTERFVAAPVRHHWRIHFREKGRWFGGGTFELRMEPLKEQEQLIRFQRLAWLSFIWVTLAYVAVFHALPFVAGEIAGTNK